MSPAAQQLAAALLMDGCRGKSPEEWTEIAAVAVAAAGVVYPEDDLGKVPVSSPKPTYREGLISPE